MPTGKAAMKWRDYEANKIEKTAKYSLLNMDIWKYEEKKLQDCKEPNSHYRVCRPNKLQQMWVITSEIDLRGNPKVDREMKGIILPRP